MSDEGISFDDLITECIDVDPDDYVLPSYSTAGRILVHALGLAHPYESGLDNVYRFSTEVLDHDGCAFWIQEGEGFDYWLDNVDELEVPGYYVIEGIVGTYHRGDWWTTDDYVVWDWGPVRPATEEEIASAALADVKK